MITQLSDFNLRAELVFKSENAAKIDPKSIIPNMFKVIKEFSSNLSALADSVKFLFYKDRYFLQAQLSQHEITLQSVQESALPILEEYKSILSRINDVTEELQSSSSEISVFRE